MRTTKLNRALSLLLVLVMIMTLLPTAAFAADADTVSAKLVTDASQLAVGDKILIAAKDFGYVISTNQKPNNRATADAVKSGSSITAGKDAQVITLEAGMTEGTFAFNVGDGYLYVASSSKNYLKTAADKSDNASWKIAISEDGTASIIAQGANTKNVMQYNSGSTLFACYEKTTQSALSIYKVAADPYADIDKKYSVYEKVDSVSAGDTVVIYNAGNGMAMASETSGFYLAGASAEINSNGYMTVLPSKSQTIQWVVGVDADNSYTFTQGDKVLSSYESESNGKKYTNISTDASKNTGWLLDTVTKGDSTFNVIYSAKTASSYGKVYLEWYTNKNNVSGFTVYGTSADKVTEKDFGMTFYKLVREGVSDAPEDNGLPAVGSKVVIYNQNAKGSLAVQNDAYCAKNAPTTVKDGVATPSNGAVVFEVQKNGEYYRFYNETYGYLCSNGTGKNAFYSKDFTGTVNDVELKAEDADWLVRTCSGGVGGYEMESRSAKYSGHSQWLEYYSDCYQTYSMYKVEDYTIYSFYFYPVAQDVKLTGDVVIKPVIEFPESVPAAYLGDDYEITVPFCSILGIDNPWTEYSIRDAKGNLIGDIMGSTDVEVLGDYTTGDGTVHFTIWDNDIEAAAKVGNTFTFTAAFKDTAGNEARASITVQIKDEPVISNLTPAQGSETLDNKTPTISADIANAGDKPTVEMTVNGEKVNAVYENGKISYTPAAAMDDGKVVVNVKVTRADNKVGEKSWSFTVGESQYQLYFGQLHSHTGQYSDGAGTLDSALSYVAGLPDSANVDFVAFTDHSNYFDEKGSANPEEALYDMSKATVKSQELWKSYKGSVAQFNATHSGKLVALAGFEMTWSGGPGHINTFNTPGIVSRNNSTLNNKTADAGMKAYYALLSQAEGNGSVSQFNHPGKTFGNFSDFSYWNAVADSRIFLVEVGNGEGQIGAGGYYPSYEQYIMALDKGWHVAPTNNQDNHKGKWGNANDARDVILTDNFTEEGVYQALRDMRVYSTEDKNLEINYSVNDLPLGSTIAEVPEKLNLSVSVHDPDATDTISKVEVVVNSGKTIHTWSDAAELAKGELSVELKPDYSYYFIRVTEADGDLAVTAPVWVGDSLKLGISSVESGTATPVTGEELTLTTTLFNSESKPATIKSIVYSTNGDKVLYTDENAGTIEASQNKTVTWKFTPEVAKLTSIKVTVYLELNGKDYNFSKEIELDVLNANNLVYVGIDAAHYNEYVDGNYKDSMGNFSNLAAQYGVRAVMLKTSDELVAACSNPKYKALILTAPTRRNGTVLKDPYACYADNEIAAIAEFNANGGTVVVSGWSDQYEKYGTLPDGEHMSDQQNKLLRALGSSLRIGDDTAYDDVNGASSDTSYGKWRLYPSNYNMDNMLLKGVEFDAEHPNDNKYTQLFSQYGGATVYAVDSSENPTATLPGTVSPAVYSFSTTVSKDMDNDGRGGTSYKYAMANGDSAVMLLATEQLPGKGLVVVSGAAFMSNFEVQAKAGDTDSGAEKNYSNYTICENLATYINPIKVTPIADVQAEKEEGVRYTIEGVVTSNASGYDKDTAFFDCIYVQDETAGINAFPVAGEFKIGDKVRITGTTSSYQGERQIAVKSNSCVKIGEATPVAPKNVTAKMINDGSVLGSLIKISGTVTRIENSEGLVQTIMVKDVNGDVCRLFIDGYITKDKTISGLSVGCTVTAVGLASYDDSFALDGSKVAPRVRIRDRADIVCTEGKPMPFTDVDSGAWYYNYVKYAWDNGLMVGTTDTTFEPNANMTRAMLAVVLYRMAGTPSVKGMSHPFTDVGDGYYAADAITWAYNAGVTAGTSNTTFEPELAINREQIVSMIYRFVKADKPSGTLSFKDSADISSWAVDAVLWASQNKVVSGYPDGTFLPQNNATRAEVTTIIALYHSK